jgi:hypothetical protein
MLEKNEKAIINGKSRDIATFGTRHKTKTNNTKIMTQKSKKRSNTDLTKNKM